MPISVLVVNGSCWRVKDTTNMLNFENSCKMGYVRCVLASGREWSLKMVFEVITCLFWLKSGGKCAYKCASGKWKLMARERYKKHAKF